MNIVANATQTPVSRRFNARMLVFTGVILLLIGYPVFVFVNTQLHGGVWEVHDERGQRKQVELKELSGFEMDQIKATNDDIPRKYRDLDGQRVELVGEMYNSRSMGGIQSNFDLVYSIKDCCVTPSPKVQHFIRCTAQSGKQLIYIPGMVSIIGKLRVGIERDGETILSVYRMDVESVRKFE
jgi:hypothetical protein